MDREMTGAADLLRGATFRRLLASGAPVTAEELAAELGWPRSEVSAIAEELAGQGRIRVDGAGRIVGSAGLSVEPDRHRIELDGRRFWTWCAYDIVGIFGALRASGTAVSPDPDGATPIEVGFQEGRPLPTGVVLFRPDERLMASCANVHDDWCPDSNFFRSREAARGWAEARRLEGEILDLPEATEIGARAWGLIV